MKSYSAGGIVLNVNGDVLLVVQLGPSISFPKGRIKENEDPETAARREILEESGVDQLVMVEDLGTFERPNIFKPEETKVIHMFLFTTDQLELNPTDPENPEAMWVKREDVAVRLTSDKDADFFRDVFLKMEAKAEILGETIRR